MKRQLVRESIKEEIEKEEVEEIEEEINPAAMEKGKNVIEHPDKFKKVL